MHWITLAFLALFGKLVSYFYLPTTSEVSTKNDDAIFNQNKKRKNTTKKVFNHILTSYKLQC
jgi:hypothetical protein